MDKINTKLSIDKYVSKLNDLVHFVSNFIKTVNNW